MVVGLYHYWEKHPPVNETFAAFVGYGAPTTGTSRGSQSSTHSVDPANRIVVANREDLIKDGVSEDEASKQVEAQINAAAAMMSMLGGGLVTRNKKKKS